MELQKNFLLKNEGLLNKKINNKLKDKKNTIKKRKFGHKSLETN